MENYNDIVANSIVTIDLKEVKRNVEKIKAHLGESVTFMPVLKANSCGHGLVETASYLEAECGIDIFGVSVTKEAKLLRDAGIKTDIMIIAAVPFSNGNLDFIVRENLIAPAYNKEFTKALSDKAVMLDKSVRVHLKVNTGLGRLGVENDKLEEFIDYVKALPNICIEGIYTHFAEAEIPVEEFTNLQIERFDKALEIAKSKDLNLKYIHACNTPGAVRYKNAHYNMVRCGLLWQGYDPCEDMHNRLDLKRVLKWQTYIVAFRYVKKGETIGYVRSYTAKRDCKLALLSIGYGDGYLEDLKKNGEVLIGGEYAPIVAINMDQMIIDVTDIADVELNDMVTLIGYDGDKEINALDLEKKTKNSYVFYLCNIGERPHKIYMK